MTVDPTVIVTAILVAVLIALSAFYSAAETSITSSSRARMFQLEKEGDRGAARVNRIQIALRVCNGLQQVLGVQNADNILLIALIERQA